MTSSTVYTLRSESVEQTLRFGQHLGEAAMPNDVIALVGPLGTGKTYLTKGIAAGLGAKDTRIVNSPTFVIINEYEGRLHMYHVDAYRLGNSTELALLGFEEMCTAGGLVVIEWADKVRDLLPEDHLDVDLTASGDNTRDFKFTTSGPESEKLLCQLRSEHGQT